MIQFVIRVCKLEPKWLRTDEKHVGLLPFIFQGGICVCMSVFLFLLPGSPPGLQLIHEPFARALHDCFSKRLLKAF